MSVTVFRSDFCRVLGGGGGSGCHFLPYILQHSVSGRVSQKNHWGKYSSDSTSKILELLGSPRDATNPNSCFPVRQLKTLLILNSYVVYSDLFDVLIHSVREIHLIHFEVK
jgi:hypothetical protein